MKEIKVGEHVRTFNGLIGKVVQLTDSGNYAIRIYNGAEYVVRAVIAKHSKNIIDLIEVGDYVNGNEVLDKYLFNGEKPVLETTGDETNAKCVCEGDIRTILTKELYKANCYTVERKE